MPGAWEINNQQRVLVAILTREVAPVAWAFGFRNLQIPGSYTALSGMPFDHGRNTGCQKLLEIGWEWLFFLDDDVIPPADAIHRLLAHKKPIVSGLYYRRASPIYPVMLRELPDGGTKWVTEFKAPDLLEVDYVGAGCLLIHRDVIANFPPLSPTSRWFEWRVDRTDLPPNERMSEDFSFCKQARRAGHKIYVDTGVQCRHAGYGESKIGGTFSPLELMTP
jgi:hypothetical protein